MAMITCPECKKQISSEATVCPKCGKTFTQQEMATAISQSNKSSLVIGVITALVILGIIVALSVGCPAISGSNQPPRVSETVYNSPWDASVSQVKDYLSKNLKDPKSVEYIEWSEVSEYGGNLIVRVKYRAKNSFGGYVTSNQLFTLSKAGKVLSVQDYQ